MQSTEAMHTPILDQMEAYNSMQQELEREYPGRWVLIHERRLQGDYDTFESAEEATETMGLHPMLYLVKQVGVDPITVIPFWRSKT